MTSDERVLEILRAANPVPHHRDAIRVVRETDPLWQTVQARLADRPDEGMEEQVAPRTRSEEHGTMSTITPPRQRRTWIGLAAAAASLAVLVAIVLVRPSGHQIEYVGGSPGEQPSYLLTPEELEGVLDVQLERVNFEQGTGLAPRDCTALGIVETEQTTTYASFLPTRGVVAANAHRFVDAATATSILARIRDDIQDCDRSEHALFGADLEAITDVEVGDESFVLSTTDDDGRDCEIWVQGGDVITHVSVLDLDPSIEQCENVARTTADALTRR